MSHTLHSKGTLLALLERAIQNAEPQEVITRLQWFVHFAEHRSISKTCDEFSIARSTFYRWYYRLNPEDLSTLRNQTKTHLLREPSPPQNEHVHVCPFCKLSVWMSRFLRKDILFVILIMALLNISFILFVIPQTAKASTWSTKTLINTESFQVIDEGDGATDLFIQFGDTLNKRITYDRTEENFHLDANVEVIGTMSGHVLQGQDAVRSSGSLLIDGSDIFFNALNCSAHTNGGTLTVDANGKVICADDDGGGATTTLQDAYDNDVDGDDSTITLSADDDSVTIVNPASSGTDSAYVFTVRQNATQTGSGMLIDSQANSGGILAINGRTEGELTKSAPHILFGYNNIFDTTLFRSAAETLRTTSTMIIDQSLHVNNSIAGSGSLTIEGTTQFQSATDSLTFFQILDADGGTPIFSVDTVNERIGIKDASPDFMLDVNDSIRVQGGLRIGGTGDSDYAGTIQEAFGTLQIINDANSHIGLFTDGGTLHLDDTGNVGIGIEGAETKLEVIGTASGHTLHASSNLTFDSDAAFRGTLDHAITANRTWTFPDATTTLVGDNTTQTITNKTIDVNQNSIQNLTGALIWYVDGDLLTGPEQSVTLTLPYAFSITDIELHAKEAPTGSSMIIDINEGGSTIFSTRAEIDSGATVEDGNHAFSDTSLAKGAEITLDIDQIGSTTSGKSLTVQLMGTIDL